MKKERKKKVDHPVPYLLDLVNRLEKDRDNYVKCCEALLPAAREALSFLYNEVDSPQSGSIEVQLVKAIKLAEDLN